MCTTPLVLLRSTTGLRPSRLATVPSWARSSSAHHSLPPGKTDELFISQSHRPVGLTANGGTCHYHLFVLFIPHAYNPVVYLVPKLCYATVYGWAREVVGEREIERASEKSKEIRLEHYACSLPSVSQWGRAQGSLATCPGWRQGLFIHKAIRVHLFSQWRCS